MLVINTKGINNCCGVFQDISNLLQRYFGFLDLFTEKVLKVKEVRRIVDLQSPIVIQKLCVFVWMYWKKQNYYFEIIYPNTVLN